MQNLKNQIMTTNMWVEQVRRTRPIDSQISIYLSMSSFQLLSL